MSHLCVVIDTKLEAVYFEHSPRTEKELNVYYYTSGKK